MKMTQDDTRILNMFCDIHDELVDSHLTEGCMGISDPNELASVNAGIATALTINKLLEEHTQRGE